jgi:hypothetical protein
VIAGDLWVIERDGTPIVVDATGAVIVCRQDGQHRGGTTRNYHRIDTEQFAATGGISPACGYVNSSHAVTWVSRRKRDLDGIWGGCSFQECFGDYDRHDTTSKVSGHSGLAATLEAMSVEEFDATVAIHTRGER